MLRASVVALMLMIAPVYAQEVTDLDDALVGLMNGDGDPVDIGETGTPDIHGSVPEWREHCGDPGEYTDSRCDPASPDYVSPREFDDDYDPEGQDKYLYTDYPNPGDKGYDEYVQWYLDGQDQSNRPAGMSDGEYVEWLEAGCGDEPTC